MLTSMLQRNGLMPAGILLGLCLCFSASLGSTHETESKTVSTDEAVKLINLKIAGSPLIRGLYQRSETGLKLLLPLPGKDQPVTMESTENSGMRLLNLIPVAGQTDMPESLLGRWRVISAIMDGKETDQFTNDEVMFDLQTLRIVENKSGSDYVGTYHLPATDHALQAAENDADSLVKQLRTKHHAIVDESPTADVIGISVHGLVKGTASAWPNELGNLLAQVPSLKSLTLTDFDFADPVGQLTFLQHLKSLETLDLRKTNVSDAALTHLASLSTLRILKLEYSPQLTDKGLNDIAELSNLLELDLAFVPVTDQSITSLTKLKSLQKLYLYGTQITDQGIQKLPELPALEVLFVGSDEVAEISDASVGTLTARKNLRTLGIPGTRLSAEGIKKLQEQLPACTLVGAEIVQKVPLTAKLEILMDTGTATGVATINGNSVNLNHCFAYRRKGQPTDPITILVTSEPVRLSELETALSRYGDDYTFAPFIDQIRICLRADGTAESIHIVVDGKTVNDAGPHLVATTSIRDDELEGTAMVKGPAKSGNLFYAVNLEFKAEIRTPQINSRAE